MMTKYFIRKINYYYKFKCRFFLVLLWMKFSKHEMYYKRKVNTEKLHIAYKEQFVFVFETHEYYTRI